jgi:hypothetical protein
MRVRLTGYAIKAQAVRSLAAEGSIDGENWAGGVR